jgi:hypothetical protein
MYAEAPVPRGAGSLRRCQDGHRTSRRVPHTHGGGRSRRRNPTASLALLALLVTGRHCWAASGCTTTIADAFNATPIAAGSVIWFNTVLSLSGLHSGGATVNFDNVTISFAAGGTPYTLSVPGATVTVSPTAPNATTTFDATTGRWKTIAPAGLAGNVFLDGLAFPVPTDLPGNIKPVTWSGQFSSDTPGVTIQWQWAAAVYTTFGTEGDSLGVKPVDDKKASIYQNLDPAGTPESFKAFLTGGATGNGSNFTGSSSAHVFVSGCPLCTTAADCDDGDSCTADSCDAQAGCQNTPIPGCTTTTIPPSTTTTSSTTTTTSIATTTSLVTTTTTVAETTTTSSTTSVPSTTASSSTTTTAQQSTTTVTTTTVIINTTTSFAATTTTTRPTPAPEVCGNCQHETGAGLVDFEDPACCGASTPLGVRALMFRSTAALDGGRLRLDAIYAPTVPALFDPLTQDTSVQVRDRNGELVCATLSAAHWEHPHVGLYRFRNRGGALATGLTEARFIVTRAGQVVFHASGRVHLRAIDGAGMLVTVRVGSLCGHSALDLRSRRKALVFP